MHDKHNQWLVWYFLSIPALVSVPKELDSFGVRILGLSILVISINPQQFLRGLNLSPWGIELFRGSSLRVLYCIFINKPMAVSTGSESQCSRNQTFSGFDSRGCLLEFYKKTCDIFSEVRSQWSGNELFSNHSRINSWPYSMLESTHSHPIWIGI